MFINSLIKTIAIWNLPEIQMIQPLFPLLEILYLFVFLLSNFATKL